MPKITFVLKNPASDKDTAIKLLYTCADGRLQYYTGESIHPDKWPGNIPRGTTAVLNRIRAHIEKVLEESKVRDAKFTKEFLKSSLDKLLSREPKQKKELVTYFDLMTEVIDKMQSGAILIPKSKKKYSPGSIKTFRFTASFLKDFDSTMTAASVTLETYNRFIQYCHGKNYSTNYIGTQIKNWKRLGKLIGGNDIFDSGKFLKIQEEADDIYLDESELEKINSLVLAGKREHVRDWFIIDCYTGLRVSDILLLKARNYSNGFITIANEKTDEKTIIPVHPLVKKILSKYKGFPPEVRSDEINEYIKPIARQAGILSEILVTITKGGKREDAYKQKWQLVTAHTARRSMITNLRKNGVADTIVMKLTGIKSPQTLQKYDKLSAGEAAKIAAQHEFFR